MEECKDRTLLSRAMRAKVRLINRRPAKSGQEVFMGDLPLMTDNGTFIINGAERVVVSQLVRSPGVYFSRERHTSGKYLYQASIIPNRGAWLEFETDVNDVISVRVDRTRKIPATVLLRAMGLGTNQKLMEVFGEDVVLRNTIEGDTASTEEEALIEIYKRLRPGEPPTPESARGLFESLFYDPRRYDLAPVGRYKLNKKLRLGSGSLAACWKNRPSIPETGRSWPIEPIDRRLAMKLEAAGVPTVLLKGRDGKLGEGPEQQPSGRAGPSPRRM